MGSHEITTKQLVYRIPDKRVKLSLLLYYQIQRLNIIALTMNYMKRILLFRLAVVSGGFGRAGSTELDLFAFPLLYDFDFLLFVAALVVFSALKLTDNCCKNKAYN